MERKGTTGTALTSEIVSSAKEELPVEMDFVLPDDCPDIVKILHASLQLGASTAEVGADGLAIEGSVTAEVWYIADTGLLHRTESSSGFSKKCRLELPEGCHTEPGSVLLQAACDYANARAVNQRRLEVKGALALYPQVSAIRQQSYLTDCTAEDVEVLKTQHEAVCAVGGHSTVFTVDEERVLESSPPVGVMLRCEAYARLTDQKAVEERLVTKGELTVRCVYLPHEADEAHDAPVSVDFTLPVSMLAQQRVFDTDAECCAAYRVCRVRAEPRADETGERRILHLRADLSLDTVVHKTVTVSGAADAYGLRHPVVLQHGTLQLPERVEWIERTLPVRKSFEHPVSGVTEILDVWATVTPSNPRQEETELKIPVKLQLYALIRDSNGRPAFFERTEELCFALPVSVEHPVCRNLVASVNELAIALTESTRLLVQPPKAGAFTGNCGRRNRRSLLSRHAADAVLRRSGRIGLGNRQALLRPNDADLRRKQPWRRHRPGTLPAADRPRIAERRNDRWLHPHPSIRILQPAPAVTFIWALSGRYGAENRHSFKNSWRRWSSQT